MHALVKSRWFYILIGVLVLMPPYVSKGFNIFEIPKINSYILTHSIKPGFVGIFPVFNLAMLFILAGVCLFAQRMNRIFSLFASVAYLLSACLQNISISEKYGFAICFSTFLLTLLVGWFWFQDFLDKQKHFSQRPDLLRYFLLIPFALIAIWQPLNPASLQPSFKLSYLLSSGSVLSFCMLTIVSLSILLLYFPDIHLETLRVTSLVGLLIGIGNLWLEFIYLPGLFWVGVLHIPLVALSALGVFLSFRMDTINAKKVIRLIQRKQNGP
jgi:hypothetical protein